MAILLGLVTAVAGFAPPRDFADPFVLRHAGGYYAFATGAGGKHVQAVFSRDLSSWSAPREALPALPAWASTTDGFTWAPSVLPLQGKFVLYYTTRHAASGFQCISRAVSASPGGPYRDDSRAPMICPVGDTGGAASAGSHGLCGSIDPSPFVDGQGKAYLLWKSDENSAACHGRPRLWSQRLTADGRGVDGAPVALLETDRTWEGPIIEGPSMVRNGGKYYLFYSANRYESSSYAVGYAICAGPMGPCTKMTNDAPLVASAGAILGPGGQEFFAGASGQTWMAYHAWTAPRTTYDSGGVRSLRVAPITFRAGLPRLLTLPAGSRAARLSRR